MLSRTFLLFAAVTLSQASLGCAAAEAPVDSETASLESELAHLDLQSNTRMARATPLPEEGTVRVAYEAATNAYGVPLFEAVRFDAAAAGTVEITVEGDFPSRASVLVTDEAFRPLAASMTISAAAGQRAVLHVPVQEAGNHLVLVRDMSWVKPMTFDVKVSARASQL